MAHPAFCDGFSIKKCFRCAGWYVIKVRVHEAMKRLSPLDESQRFKPAVRHYHRAGSSERRSWDEWIGDKPGGKDTLLIRLLKALVLVLALVVIGGLIIGVVVVFG